MNNKVNNEEFEKLLSSYYKRIAPYTFRVKERKNYKKEFCLMKKSVLIKVFSITACMALIITAVIAFPGMNGGKDNYFTITANAHTASSSEKPVKIGNSFKPAGELKPFGGGSTEVYNGEKLEEKTILRLMDFSYACKGNNIKTVTYTAHNGAFKIINNKGVIDSKKSEFLYDTEKAVWQGEVVSSYTVGENYKEIKLTDEANISLISRIDLLSEDCPKELKNNYKKDFNSKEQAQRITQLEAEEAVKYLSVDITAEYKDGTSETKTLVFEPKVDIINWQIDSDGEYSYNSITNIKAKIE